VSPYPQYSGGDGGASGGREQGADGDVAGGGLAADGPAVDGVDGSGSGGGTRLASRTRAPPALETAQQPEGHGQQQQEPQFPADGDAAHGDAPPARPSLTHAAGARSTLPTPVANVLRNALPTPAAGVYLGGYPGQHQAPPHPAARAPHAPQHAGYQEGAYGHAAGAGLQYGQSHPPTPSIAYSPTAASGYGGGGGGGQFGGPPPASQQAAAAAAADPGLYGHPSQSRLAAQAATTMLSPEYMTRHGDSFSYVNNAPEPTPRY